MPEWWIERGIGETRCVLVDDGKIVEARILVDGIVRAGSVIEARLVTAAPRNAVARDENGAEYLLPKGAPGATEGAMISIEVAREKIPGAEPWKRALARVADGPPRDAPPLTGPEFAFPSPTDELSRYGWNDLIDEARSGIVRFGGGELRISPSPAMTLIDVDGFLLADELAVLGAAEAAKAVHRLDIGGSIGIDLPTTSGRTARQRAAAAIDEHLPPPFERTAVNGFGFVQIVRPRLRASLLELAQDRAGFEARALLRRAAFEPPGAKALVAHPTVIALLVTRREWIDELARQVGGKVELRADASLPISGGYAQSL